MSCRSLRELDLSCGFFSWGLRPRLYAGRSLRELKAVSDFEHDFVGLVPMISKAMAVPILADLFRRACVRNAASLIVAIFAHTVFVRRRPCRGRSRLMLCYRLCK